MTPGQDVVVIGLGPTGAVLAGLLGLCGLRVLVLERDAELHDLPRAVHYDDEVMRVFQTLGVADQVSAVSRINLGMRFVDADGQLLLDWPRPQEVGPQGWHASYRFHQPDLDRILRARLEAMPRVEVRLGAEVTGLEDCGDHVRVTCNGGTTATACFAVGCDGARSFVRGLIGGQPEDLGFNERWLVVDALLRYERPDLGDVTAQHCNPARPATYVRGPGNRRRWEITLHDGEDGADPWPYLARWVTPDEAEIERAAVYTFHSTIAGCWRRGRLLIAGDAAHQTPPFMGQGMCAGIRDAANLAWKLAECVRGAGENLLDSYQSERHPHVRAYIETAVRLGGLINASGTEAALRSVLRVPDGSDQMATITPRLGKGIWRGGIGGRLSPQISGADHALADDRVGYRTCLVVPAGTAIPEPDLPLITFSPDQPIAQQLAAVGTTAALIRPDRYFAAGVERIDDLPELVSWYRATAR